MRIRDLFESIFLFILGVVGGIAGAELLKWLAQKNKYKCPRCNYPVFHAEYKACEFCGQQFKRVTNE